MTVRPSGAGHRVGGASLKDRYGPRQPFGWSNGAMCWPAGRGRGCCCTTRPPASP